MKPKSKRFKKIKNTKTFTNTLANQPDDVQPKYYDRSIPKEQPLALTIRPKIQTIDTKLADILKEFKYELNDHNNPLNYQLNTIIKQTLYQNGMLEIPISSIEKINLNDKQYRTLNKNYRYRTLNDISYKNAIVFKDEIKGSSESATNKRLELIHQNLYLPNFKKSKNINVITELGLKNINRQLLKNIPIQNSQLTLKIINDGYNLSNIAQQLTSNIPRLASNIIAEAYSKIITSLIDQQYITSNLIHTLSERTPHSQVINALRNIYEILPNHLMNDITLEQPNQIVRLTENSKNLQQYLQSLNWRSKHDQHDEDDIEHAYQKLKHKLNYNIIETIDQQLKTNFDSLSSHSLTKRAIYAGHVLNQDANNIAYLSLRKYEDKMPDAEYDLIRDQIAKLGLDTLDENGKQRKFRNTQLKRHQQLVQLSYSYNDDVRTNALRILGDTPKIIKKMMRNPKIYFSASQQEHINQNMWYLTEQPYNIGEELTSWAPYYRFFKEKFPILEKNDLDILESRHIHKLDSPFFQQFIPILRHIYNAQKQFKFIQPHEFDLLD